MKMKNIVITIIIYVGTGLFAGAHNLCAQSLSFLKVQGKNIVKSDGTTFFIKGTNLGNWLNPEGYMFGFKKTNSASMIDRMFRQLVGEEATDEFWAEFKDNYVTRPDIKFMAECGVNTIRLPLHYKLFTNEDYLGIYAAQDGFKRIDNVVKWCKENGIYLILDMHCAPGGQTGGNVDDSYGYPWLFTDTKSEALLTDIWQKIAERYKDEPAVLGYELLNEPIEHRDNIDDWDIRYYPFLEPLYKRLTKAIRSIDSRHIIILGGARGNTDFSMFKDWKFDNNIIYSCHCYSVTLGVRPYVQFRDRTGIPMYVGETGHFATLDEQTAMNESFIANNLGYTYWPYKKYKLGGSFVWFAADDNWQEVIDFAESDRSTYAAIRKARPDQTKAREAMKAFVRNCLFENCTKDENYIRATKLK